LEFVKFAYELENMLLHIFRLEAKAPPKRPADKGSGREEPRAQRRRAVADRKSRKGDFATVPSRSHENTSRLKPGKQTRK
jgi:hypothetical protein